MKDRWKVTTVTMLIIALALLVSAMILWRYASSLTEVIESQRLEIAELRDSVERLEQEVEERVGGAEVPMPAPQAAIEGWSFPIAEEDFLMLTSPTGYRVSPILKVEMYHNGVDIAATWRAQVVAASDGVVVRHYPVPGTPVPGQDGVLYRGHDVFGGMIEIEHEDGWRTLYAHLSDSRVHQGMRVQQGQVIGRVGNTGRSRGDHLHFELINPDGAHVNPLVYVSPEPIIEEEEHEPRMLLEAGEPDIPYVLEYGMRPFARLYGGWPEGE